MKGGLGGVVSAQPNTQQAPSLLSSLVKGGQGGWSRLNQTLSKHRLYFPPLRRGELGGGLGSTYYTAVRAFSATPVASSSHPNRNHKRNPFTMSELCVPTPPDLPPSHGGERKRARSTLTHRHPSPAPDSQCPSCASPPPLTPPSQGGKRKLARSTPTSHHPNLQGGSRISRYEPSLPASHRCGTASRAGPRRYTDCRPGCRPRRSVRQRVPTRSPTRPRSYRGRRSSLSH